MSHDPNCLFCKIATGQIPSAKVHEDDELLVFKDIHPAAPVHLLVIPKVHVASLADADDSHAPLLGRMLALAPKLAREQGANNGFRVVINTGHDGGQEVHHLHLHVMGGPRPWKHG
ncbi:histidine triad nucleotide-binding protein [Leptothrix discophora]|uniref:Histidine triad nucleotide-binding protein n=1 Tax=Leptothrix discophora TaxID=89 RepID=A0ABT9G585_LEPDI|nr:histidine triad nucleotide-binding protein [Leptothrix discophora]MDP4301556.1 histidine triad nucleotide-binding protein [Leptothrix discophora]